MDEAIEWLRQQVQARLDAAQKASTGDQWEAERHYDALWTVDFKPGAGMVAAGEEWQNACIGMENAQPYEDPRFVSMFVYQARHIALNDPQDVIARCEAELAILNLHDLWAAEAKSGELAAGAAACAVAVHHLAGGYRHRDGYAQHWERV